MTSMPKESRQQNLVDAHSAPAHRRKIGGRLALAFLPALFCLVLGWLLNSILGVDETYKLPTGAATHSARHMELTAPPPLGFSLLLQRRIDDFGPIDIRVSVRDRATGAEHGLLELRENGQARQLPGTDLFLELDRFDDETGDMLLRARNTVGDGRLVFSIGHEPQAEVEFGKYALTLNAHRIPSADLRTRCKIAILEGNDIVLESWLEEGAELRWRGVRIRHAGKGEAPDGTPHVVFQATKQPGKPFFWLALVFLAFAMLRLPSLRASRPQQSGPPQIRSSRQLVFTLTGLVLALALLEGGARVIEWARDALLSSQNPYVDRHNPAPLFEINEADGQRTYRRSKHHRLVMGNQSFLRVKPPSGFRVFILGGSAAAGWPYEIGEFSTARLLHKKLSLLFPNRTIEVLNVAGGTYGSHRVKSVLDEVINYQPDLIVIYSGNNEFLENFVYRRRLPPQPLNHLALARIGYDIFSRLNNYKPSYNIDDFNIKDQTSNRIAFAFGKASNYRKDPQQFADMLDHYRYNIDSMVTTCQQQKVDVLLLNVPANLKDWIPNASQHSRNLPETAFPNWQENFREGFLALEAGDHRRAATFLATAAAIDDEHAESHYYLGVALHRLGDLRGAKQAYVRALERDAYPFRALPQFQDILKEIATRHSVPLVDIIGALERDTADGIIGLDVLLDYVHPTEESMEIIAHKVLTTMEQTRMFPEPPVVAVDKARLQVASEFRPFIESKAIEALYRQYLVMRQYDKLDQVYANYIATMQSAMAADKTLESFCLDGIRIVNTLQPIVAAYRDLLRAGKLGLLEQTYSKEEAQEIYQNYVDMIQAIEAPDMTRESFLLQVPKLEYRAAEPN